MGERTAKTMYYLLLRSNDTLSIASLAQDTDSISIWHQRLGHADSRNIRRMFNLKIVDGLKLSVDPTENHVCPGCAKGKMHRLPFYSSTSLKAAHIGGRIHSDVCGPMSYSSLGGAR